MDGKAAVLRSNGITKSDSVKSHKSVTFLGSHPLGSLRIYSCDDSPLSIAKSTMDEDEGPPPLGPAASSETSKAPIRPGIPHTLSQDAADRPKRKLRHGMGGGDVVLIIDLPEVFTVGYDSLSFTAKNFVGVKDVPKGAHFFWVGHASGTSARCGFWIISSGVDQVHVMQWDKFNEVLEEPARSEARFQADSVDSIHSTLVPYHDPGAVNVSYGDTQTPTAQDGLKIWKQVADYVSEDVLDYIVGRQAVSWCIHTGDRVKGSFLIPAEVELDRKITSRFLRTRSLRFTFNQHSRIFSTKHTGADRTEEATDSTRYIVSLLDDTSKSVTEEQLVGEFQFSFVAGMTLGNDSCLQQWWHTLLKLILRAYRLPVHRPLLAASLLRTLATQLSYSSEYLESSIIDYGESRASDLRLALTIYKSRMDELLLGLGSKVTADQLSVSTAFAKIEVLAVSMGWDLRGDYLRTGKVMLEDGEYVDLEMSELQDEDERGEWAPELVELDEDGRQRDLVSWTD